MSLAPRLDLRQSQSLVMTPQLQQAIRLLALSNVELEAFLADEIDKNPLLDATREDEGIAPAAADPPAPDADAALDQSTLDEGGGDVALDLDYDGETFHQDSASDRSVATAGAEDIDFDSFAGAAPTLTDHLLRQAGEVLGGGDLAIAAQLIDAIDDAGYLTVTLRDVATRIGAPLAQVERVLAVIHAFDPTGVGARDLAECLALQAREADRYDPCMALLIANLDLLATGKIGALQRTCGVDDEDIADMIRELRGYDPKPGLRFGRASVEAVTPDVFVTATTQGWRVEINAATLPRVLVDRRYHAELTHGADKAARGWLSDCLASANWLVKALDQRQRTIVKVASAIVAAQGGFFRTGISALKPLTLRQVADIVGLHESTVSRVTSNKYLHCPRGTFELKFFLTSGIAGADGGEAASGRAVKDAIARLIAHEGDDVLSDDALVDRLRDGGFDLARRTVAKYREALGLGSSVARRRARAIEVRARG